MGSGRQAWRSTLSSAVVVALVFGIGHGAALAQNTTPPHESAAANATPGDLAFGRCQSYGSNNAIPGYPQANACDGDDGTEYLANHASARLMVDLGASGPYAEVDRYRIKWSIDGLCVPSSYIIEASGSTLDTQYVAWNGQTTTNDTGIVTMSGPIVGYGQAFPHVSSRYWSVLGSGSCGNLHVASFELYAAPSGTEPPPVPVDLLRNVGVERLHRGAGDGATATIGTTHGHGADDVGPIYSESGCPRSLTCANDGNDASRIAFGATGGQSVGPDELWLTGDLGPGAKVDRVRFAADDGVISPSGYAFSSSDDDLTYAVQAYLPASAIVRTGLVDGLGNPIVAGGVTLPSPVVARYWRITQLGHACTGCGFYLTSFETYGQVVPDSGSAPGDLLHGAALGQLHRGAGDGSIATIGSSHGHGADDVGPIYSQVGCQTLTCIVDGNDVTSLGFGAAGGQTIGPDELWLTGDLVTAATVTRVRFASPYSSAISASGYVVSSSDDDISYTVRALMRPSAFAVTGRTSPVGPVVAQTATLASPLQARYWRITQLGHACVGCGFYMASFELYGSPGSHMTKAMDLVSVGSPTAQGVGFVTQRALSADGRFVVFASPTDGLVPDDTNGFGDAFVRDLWVGTTTRVSVGPTGAAPDGASYQPTISSDGRFVVFSSWASNLAPGDTNGAPDVFVRDLVTGITTLASVNAAGAAGNGASDEPSISANGRYVVFTSGATDITGSLPHYARVVVRDLLTATNTVLFATVNGVDCGGFSPDVSGDGHFVVFTGCSSVFRYDTTLGTTEEISPSPDGSNALDRPVISDDGRFMAYQAIATDEPQTTVIYFRDRDLGTTTTIAKGRDRLAISPDGRFLLFSTDADAPPGDATPYSDTFLWDRTTGAFEQISVTATGTAGNSASFSGSLTPDGRFVAFTSTASDLVANDTDGHGRNVFLRDRSLPLAPPPPADDTTPATYGDSPLFGMGVMEPVNTLTGNLTLSATDLSFAGRGPALILARTYNARDARAGVFGPGWTGGIAWRVSERSGGAQAVVTRGDGRGDVHQRQADGSYAPPAGVFDRLTRTASGWRLVTPAQLQLEFASTGVIQRMADRNGSVLTYATDAAGRVTGIADAVGRSIALAYNADGTVAQATDSSSRRVSYAYTSGRLTAVTDRLGGVTGYAYDRVGRLATVVDPLRNTILANTYDSTGRVIEQRDAVGAVSHFTYDAAARTTTITSPRGMTTVVTHDANGRVITLTDGLGAIVSYTYDARGDQTSMRDRNGNLWTFGYDDHGNRTLVTDSAGATAKFTFDAQNDLLTRTDPLGHTWHYTYDARGDLATVADPEGGTAAMTTDAFGQVTAITDADGVVISYAYDQTGSVVSITNPSGIARTTYDGAGRAVSATDPNGSRTTFTYDALDRLTGSTDALGATTAMRYDAAGNLVGTTDRGGAATQLFYDAKGQLIRTIDALGGVSSFTFDPNGNRTTIIDAASARLAFAYDQRDRLAQVTDAIGGVSTFGYDANGNLTATTDPRGNTAHYTYNFRNQRETTTDRLGQVSRSTYDAAGRPTGSTDPLGATTRLTYDRADRYTATADALNGTTSLAYTAAGRRASITDPLGNRTAFAYDPAGRLAILTDALGGVMQYAYDANGNRVAQTDQLGRITRLSYDAADRLSTTTDPLGGTTRMTYDAAGALASLIDARGNATAYGYDALGRLTTVRDALGGATHYTYDTRGLITGLTDANGHGRAYAYDGNRRLIRETDGLGRARVYTYDANGNAAGLLDPKGHTTGFTYDAENRLSAIRYADGSTVALARDAVGNRTRMVDPNGATSYAYDLLRRMTQTTDAFGKSVTYGYDANGNRSSLRYPDGTTAGYSYDGLGRLRQVADGLGGSDHYRYNAVGDQIAADFANGSATRSTFDALGRVTTLANLDGRGRAVDRLAYTYDALGNVTSENNGNTTNDGNGTNADQHASTYTYDALSRLVSSGGSDDQRSAFRYDAVGNRTFSTSSTSSGQDDQGLTATFDAADQLTALVRRDGKPAVRFTYDANGNLLAQTGGDAAATYTYDAADRLAGVIGNDRQRTTYRYDGDGTLVAETTSAAHADDGRRTPTTLTYVIDRALPLSQILAASDGRDVARYLYGNARIASFGSGATYYGTDVRGSVRSTTDSRGRLNGGQRYDAWGAPLSNQNGHTDNAPSSSLSALFGYTGERQDAASGRVYLRARWYDPALGRFLNRDPYAGTLADPRSSNRYAYGFDNPTSRTDPTGLSPSDIFGDGSGYAPDQTSLYADGPSFATVSLPQNAPPTVIPSSPDPGRYTRDVIGGFFGGVWNSAVGVAKIGQGAWNSSAACVYDTQSCDAQWAANQTLGTFIHDHPGDFAGAIVEGAIANCRDAITSKASNGSAVGGCTFDVVSAVVGLKGLDKVAKVGRAGEAAAGLERTAAIADAAASAGSTATRESGNVAVYVSRNAAGEVQYVGITSRFAARAAEHFAEKGITIKAVEGLTDLTRADARAIEQVLIETYGLDKNGGTLLNQINSVARSNPIYGESIARGRKLLELSGNAIP